MCFFCFCKQKTAYEMRISDWSSDVCSSDLHDAANDEGRVFLRTLVQTDEIPVEDRELSLTYVPSADLGVGSGGAFDASMYDRAVSPEKAVVGGYSCEEIGRASCRERVSQYV